MIEIEMHLTALARLLALRIADGDKNNADEILRWAYGNMGEGAFSMDEMAFSELIKPIDKKYPIKKVKKFIKRFIIEKTLYPVGEISTKIKEMPYLDFMKTPYWQSIAWYVKNKAGKVCASCGNIGGKMEVHHKTYIHHGDELHHLDDLVCLCHKCHKAEHNRKE